MGESIDFDKIPEADVVVNYVNKRLKKGLNTNIFVIGLSGTGKSSTSIRLAELILETREIEPKITIADSLLELLKAIRSSKKGDVIIIEEISVLFPSRRSMATENLSIGKVLDTCRKREVTLISNAPIWKSIDSHMRSLGHLLIETLRINKTEKVVISKFHRLQTNPQSGHTYRHTMQRDGGDISRMFTRMPNMDRWKAYEAQKDKFMDKLYERLEGEQEMKNKKIDRELGLVKYGMRGLSEKQKAMIKSKDEDGLDWEEMRNTFEYSDTDTAKRMYMKAKEKEKILISKNEKSSSQITAGPSS